MTHICVSKLTIIVSDNGLSPGRHQAIICTNAGILSIGPLGTNLSEISITIHIFSFKKMHLKMSSGKWRPFCLGFNVLKVSFAFSPRYLHNYGFLIYGASFEHPFVWYSAISRHIAYYKCSSDITNKFTIFRWTRDTTALRKYF